MGVERPTYTDVLLQVAQVWSTRSTCSRGQNGAVIARYGRTIASGYNGAPAGLGHCEHEEGEDARSGCQLSVHAEANAIAFAARAGLSTDATAIYCTTAPCYECAKLIINAGISAVYYERPYRLTSGLDLLESYVYVHGPREVMKRIGETGA